MNKYIHFISRMVAGVVFIYSGFVKAVDPLGSTYKFNDYFEAFGTIWAKSGSFGLAIIMALAEFVVGVALLLNLKPKQSTWGALIFMGIFTPLTFWLAYTNKVHDCGCFGDALVLTNWQTFWKNIVLLIPILYLFINRKKTAQTLSCAEQWAITGAFALFIGLIIAYSLRHLPILNFRPYKIGTHIPSAMSIPEGAPADVWESSFIYQKNGQNQEFPISQLPDSTWTFVEAKHKLIKKGYEPPIHDFTITDAEGIEMTDVVVNSNTYNFLLISYNLAEAKFADFENLNRIAEYCNENGFGFYALTASGNDVVAEFIENHQPAFGFYTTDETTLKTVIRSNAGLMLIHNGVIIDKWGYRDIPDAATMNQHLTQNALQKYKTAADTYYLWFLLTMGGFLAVLYLLIRQYVCLNCKK